MKGFPDAARAKPKTLRPGGGMRARWEDRKIAQIFELDYQQGMVEVYDRQGRHLGEFDPNTGQQTKPPDPSRKVEP